MPDGHQLAQRLPADGLQWVTADPTRAADPAPGCLDPLPAFQVIVTKLGLGGLALEVVGVAGRQVAGHLRDAQHASALAPDSAPRLPLGAGPKDP